MTWRFAHLHIEDRDHVLSINPLGCIYYIRILHLCFWFTTTLLYNNDRIRLKWTVQTLQLNNGLLGFFFRYIMQEILIIQKNNFIQFNYLMFSLTIIVVVSKVATYILQKSLISPKSRLLSRIGSRQTGVPYWFFISLEYLGRCYWHEKGWQIRKLFIKRGTRYVSEGPFLSLTRLNKEIRASRDNRL